jgi:superfamily II DNA/RNA helicase
LHKFSELGVSERILSVLGTLGYIEPTEIQTKAIPIVLSGKDIIASAQTGSGKTAAFALPIIEKLKAPSNKPRALIIVPTRELAVQVKTECEKFARNSGLRTVTLYGGAGFGNQIHALNRGFCY